MNLFASNKLYPPKKKSSSDLPMAAVNGFLESLFPPTWRDQLVTASFRNVPFCVKKMSTSVGRRTRVAYHFPSEYVNKEEAKTIDKIKAVADKMTGSGTASQKSNLKYAKGSIVTNKNENGITMVDVMDRYPYVYDLGMEVLEYKIEGYLIANDYNDYNYLDHKKLLMAAFQTEGVGKLVHPTLGELDHTYVKGGVNFEEDFDEGGICRFTVTFQRGREKVLPNRLWGNKVYVKDVETSALEAWLMALDKFASNINRLGAFVASAITAVANLINRIANLVTNIAGALSSFVNSIVNSIFTLVNSLNTLLDTPCELGEAFKTAADSISRIAGIGEELDFGGVTGKCSGKRRGDTVLLNGSTVPESLGVSIANEAITALEFDESSLAGNDYGANTSEQAENMTLIVNTGKAAIITSVLPVIIRIEFTSQQKMIEILEKMTTLLDEFLLRLGVNTENVDYSDMYTYFDNLKNVFVTSMISKNVGLVNEVDYVVPTDTTSSLVLSYDRYYDLDRSWEAQKRNEPIARHPGFLPNGETIKILEA